MADLSTITTDIGSTFSNINFSYPEVDIDGNKKNGYLDLFGDSTYLHFNYDSIIIDTDKSLLCVIHKSPDNKDAYIVFNYTHSTGNDKLYKKPYIHLNHHIANEILEEGSTLKYDTNGFHILGDSSTPSKILIYFKDTTLKLNTDDIPIKIKKEIKVPTDTNIGSAVTKTFKRGMFINDEVDCEESTIAKGESTIAKNKYATTVAGNLGIGIGGGILIIVSVIVAITSNKEKLMFVNGTRLFGGWGGYWGGNDNTNIGSRIAYNICGLIILLSSIASFLAYGTGMLKNRGYNIDNKRKDKTDFLSLWLGIAIITLILFIFMIGYKGLVLIPAAR
jgi:hypothetical protein